VAFTTGPQPKLQKDMTFYGEMEEQPIVVSELNSTPTVGSAETTLVGFAHTVFVDTGANRSGIDFGNRRTAPTGSISGTVFNDLNGNAAKDAGEPSLSGWRVYIDANRNGAFESSEKSVVTGSSGVYSFSGLTAGKYNVREVDQSGWTRTNSSPIVSLAAGALSTGKNFANFQNASISGRVFNDVNRNGTQDSGDAGLSGVRVYEDKNGNRKYDSGERSVMTNSSGDYTLSGLPNGQRTIRVVLPSGRSLTSPSIGYHRLTPTSGQAVTGRRFGTKTVTASVNPVSAQNIVDSALR
jgi:hypothetical protein